MSATAANAKLRDIDRKIDDVCDELFKREPRISLTSPGSWQWAWDRHPDLRARELDLYAQRGVAQRERDEADAASEQKRRAAERRAFKKRKPCPTCGSPMFAEAA